MQGDLTAVLEPAVARAKLPARRLSSPPPDCGASGDAPSELAPSLLDTRLVRSELLRLRAPTQRTRLPAASGRQGT